MDISEGYGLKMMLSKDGSKLFLQDYNFVRIIDISNIYLPVEAGRIGLDYANTVGMSISKDEKIIYIITHDNFVSSIIARYDISSLCNPVRLTPISFHNVYAIINISDDNTFAYVSGEYGLATYDISDTNNPILVNLYNGLQTTYYAWHMDTPIVLDENKLLVGDKNV
ncbi:MAG: hypothetical protein LBD84_04350 [Campylobacteraceae bacterium]|nr:hypothetical protein [Campylobacteraceae bacterium]